MPFIPHTEREVAEMLRVIDAPDIEALFDEIPTHLKVDGLQGIAPGRTEMEVSRLMHERAERDGQPLNFIGAGAYEHHIPAAVWEITTRGEFYSAYTPYQAEASQGTLQLIYEYQTMMCGLTGMDVSNASLYDGASGLAEAVLMAARANRRVKRHRVLMPASVHPYYRACARSICQAQGFEFESIVYCAESGTTMVEALEAHAGSEISSVVIPQPNFFGQLEDVDALTDWAHAHGALVIGVVNPLALALLPPPGNWGEKGVDIVCGEGQPLGAPLSSGGPYFGFLCCKQQHVRQMPGRIVGRTVDLDGQEGYTLTLQAREQHIRRAKATSNICTNQGLVVTAATIHMALLGDEGLRRVAAACWRNTRSLTDKLCAIDGVEAVFAGTRFHEAVIRLPVPVGPVIECLSKRDLLAGFDLSADYPELGNALLVCATETKNEGDLDRYATELAAALGAGQ